MHTSSILTAVMSFSQRAGLRGPMMACDDPLDKVDIDEEYEKIQWKQSHLSASQRARVVKIYEQRQRERETVKESIHEDTTK